MPRILRNYLISFAVIGLILLIVNWIDHYLTRDIDVPAGTGTESTVSG